MRLTRLRTRGWRNLKAGDFEPGPHATVVSGPNGQGKTNLVEAIHYLMTFRSFRARKTEELIEWHLPEAKIEGALEAMGLDRILGADISRDGSKRFTLDGKGVRRDTPALRGVGAVLFVPEDLMLPKAGPAERRRFVDNAVFARERSYYREAWDYQRLQKSRNALLKERASTGLLDTYDERLAQAGARLVVRRRAFVRDLQPLVQRLFERIHGQLEVGVTYDCPEPVAAAEGDEAAVGRALLDQLVANRAWDLRRGFTGVGPHSDDVRLTLTGRLAREHASQGQLRSLVLALKLGELALLGDALGEPPLLLLDDVASELDEVRRSQLFSAISELPGQSIITVTDQTFLPALPSRTDFRVEAGLVRLSKPFTT